MHGGLLCITFCLSVCVKKCTGTSYKNIDYTLTKKILVNMLFLGKFALEKSPILESIIDWALKL